MKLTLRCLAALALVSLVLAAQAQGVGARRSSDADSVDVDDVTEQVPTLGGRAMPRFSDQGWRQGGMADSPFGPGGDLTDEEQDASIDTLYVDFADFIKATTGKTVGDALPIRTPRQSGQRLPERYAIGPGDQIEIQVWGSVNGQYKLTVDPSGRIFIPAVGSVQLQGVLNSELSNVVSGYLRKLYKGFEVRATVSSARSINVVVAGSARTVGMHTVPATTSLLGAALGFSKPTGQGSRRFIELRRAGQRQRIDLYCFFNDSCGQLPAQLLEGDVLFVPQRSRLVALTGPVGRPGIYELTDTESAQDLLRYAGGVSLVADTSQIHVHTFESKGLSTRSFRAVQLEGLCGVPASVASTCVALKDGDYVDVLSKLPLVSGVVSVVANGTAPQRIAFRAGMRLLDLVDGPISRLVPEKAMADINNPDFASASNLDESFGRLDLQSITVYRFDAQGREYLPIRVDLRAAQTGGPGSDADVPLVDGDIVVVDEQATFKTPRDSLSYSVRVLGEVQRPGRFRFEGKKTLQDALDAAGGMTPRAAAWSAVVLRLADFRSAVGKDMLDRAVAAIRDQQRRQERADGASAGAAGVDSKGAASTRGVGSLAQRNVRELQRIMKDREMVFVASAGTKINTTMELAPNDIVLIPPQQNTVACYGAFFRTGEFLLDSDKVSYKEARDRCGVIEELSPTLYHISAREGRTCREGWFRGCPDAKGGDVIIALPSGVTKSSLSAWGEVIDVIYKTAVSAATLKLLF